jgi:hypothetical protein
MTPRQRRRVEEARQVLRDLNFDAERSNERSALVLLALLDLTDKRSWSEAREPRLRTVEIMDWLRAHYGKAYKPNTRETIRRQTLHQFVDAARGSQSRRAAATNQLTQELLPDRAASA